jgi:hypothetical protein
MPLSLMNHIHERSRRGRVGTPSFTRGRRSACASEELNGERVLKIGLDGISPDILALANTLLWRFCWGCSGMTTSVRANGSGELRRTPAPVPVSSLDRGRRPRLPDVPCEGLALRRHVNVLLDA